MNNNNFHVDLKFEAEDEIPFEYFSIDCFIPSNFCFVKSLNFERTNCLNNENWKNFDYIHIIFNKTGREKNPTEKNLWIFVKERFQFYTKIKYTEKKFCQCLYKFQNKSTFSFFALQFYSPPIFLFLLFALCT